MLSNFNKIYNNKPEKSIIDKAYLILDMIVHKFDKVKDMEQDFPDSGLHIEIKDIPTQEIYKNESLYRYSYTDLTQYHEQKMISLPLHLQKKWETNIQHVKNGIEKFFI